MKIKPHVFIGSSREGLSVAASLKEFLSSWAECDIWNEPGVFELNKGYLENLLDRLNLYEYGVMVATGDDVTTSRSETKMAPRDNVLFELGLFMGRLGRDRTFYVLEKGSKLPSDLLGITLPHFPKRKGQARNRALELSAEMIKSHVKSRQGIFEGGIFPAVPLAFGYFHNFVKIVCERLALTQVARVNGVSIPILDFRMKILIPDELTDDMEDKVKFTKKIRKWEQIVVEAPETRAYEFYANVRFETGKTAILQDIPTTLRSLHQTITEFLGVRQVGTGHKEILVETREIRRFKMTLDYLIKKTSSTKGRVHTEIVDI